MKPKVKKILSFIIRILTFGLKQIVSSDDSEKKNEKKL